MFLALLRKTLAPFGALVGIMVVLMLARARFPVLRRVIPVWVILLVLAAIVIAWAAILLVRWVTEKRRAQALEKGLLDQAQRGIDEAPPARRAEIEDLKRNLGEALATLKRGPQGKKALYSLPWYMIIGPPAIGKTTAIVNSGLNFPGLTTAKRMRGAGGTRNCDWWLSTDAILLDTAGRYAESHDRSETEGEWFAFLDLLKAHRKKGPINGLILGYSVEGLLQRDEAALIDSARELRQRMDEILDRLGWTFPVYVLFTKCDLIAGFADYFSNLSPLERQQVWGAVYELEPAGDQRAAERFAREFDVLLKNLRTQRTRRMSKVARSEDWGRVFMFPEEFASLRDKMVLFIETVFEVNPYRKDVPLFRGTYFSSGRQMGRPFDLVVRKIHSMLGARAHVEEAAEQVEKEDAYFVRDLFARVLKADQDLVRLTGEVAHRRARFEQFISIGFVALALLACIGIGVSYGRLQAKMTRTKSVAEQVRDSTAYQFGVKEWEILKSLRTEIGGSWYSFPLTVVNDVRDKAMDVYLQAAKDQVLEPLEAKIAARLTRADNLNGAEVRHALRTELMLLKPGDRDDIGWDASHLSESLVGFGLDGTEDREELEAMVGGFLEQSQPIEAPDRMRELQQGRQRLAATHAPQEFFLGIVSQASQEGQDQTLASLVPDQRILSSRQILRAAFTGAGWRRSVENEINNVEDTWRSDNRLIVLAGGQPTARPPAKDDLLELYADNYPREWATFFESIEMQSYDNCGDLKDDFFKLKIPETSPMFKLLRQATDVAELPAEILGGVIPGQAVLRDIVDEMRPLKDLTEQSKDRPAPLDEYAEQLKEVYQVVDDCANESDYEPDRRIVRGAGRWVDEFVEVHARTQVASALGRLLKLPIARSESALTSGGVGRLQQEWNDQVSDFFRERLRNTYPFAGLSDDVRMANPNDVLDFFGPGGAVASFDAERQDNQAASFSGPARQALQAAKRIRDDLSMSDDAFEMQFTMRMQEIRSTGTPQGDANLRVIDSVVLTINGQTLTGRVQLRDEKVFTWRSTDSDLGCSLVLRAKQREVAALRPEGMTIWNICLLFDQAHVTDNAQARTVTWTFPNEGIEVDFLLSTRNQVEPFFIRSSPFRRFTVAGA